MAILNITYPTDPLFPNDLIDVYTFQYIQNNILKDAHGISSLHNAVKANKRPGVTDNDVDELFELYWSN